MAARDDHKFIIAYKCIMWNVDKYRRERTSSSVSGRLSTVVAQLCVFAEHYLADCFVCITTFYTIHVQKL